MSIAQNFPSIKPSLMLSFADTKKLDSRVTFARASEGRYYGQEVAKAEENLLLRSQEFDNSYWTKSGTTVTANATTAPDGTTTAELVYPASTGTTRWFYRVFSLASNIYTRSIYAKAENKSIIYIDVTGSGGTSTYFDLSAGTVGTTESGYTASIVDVGDGWYRCSIVNNSASAFSFGLVVGVADADGSTSVTANGTDGVYLWGAQLEQRDTVTAYTPTTTQPITNYIPVLQTAAANVARFDHDPVTGESLGLLVEEQRTNLVTYSEQFDNAYWVKSNSTVQSNVVVAPDGTLTGDKLVENTSNSTHLIYAGTQSFTSGTSYTASLYAKSAGRRYLILQVTSAAFGANSLAFFDLELGTFTLGLGLTTASIEAVGNDVYRCTITKTATSTATSNAIFIQLSNTATVNAYTGDGYSGIYIWGAQVEAGAFPTSYIPTVASQVTRSADAASMTGTNFSEWYRQDEGTLFAEAQSDAVTVSGSNRFFVDVGGLGNRIALLTGNISSGEAGILVQSNSATQAYIAPVSSQLLSSGQKVVGAYQFNSFQAVNNNVVGTQDTNGVVPMVSAMYIGGSFSGGVNNYLSGHIKKLAYYPLRLSNTQLQALTGS